MSALERARQDVAAGRLWKARDRLLGATVAGADDELLGLLGEIQFAMRDLPAAGAAWFVTGRSDADARSADEAWRERHGNHPVQLWMSLPGRARYREDARSQELRAVANQRTSYGLPGVPRHREPGVSEGAGCGVAAALTGLLLVVCVLVGAWTIVRWALP